MKNRYGFLLVALVAVILVAGCSQSPTAGQNIPAQPETVAPTTQAATTLAASTVAPTTVVPTIVKGDITDCSFLTLDDVKSAVGIDMKQAFYMPGTTSCSKSWIDLRSSTDASVALQVTKQASASSQQDLALAASAFEKIDMIGDYDTSWDKNGGAINFGKGEYKFQVQCVGDSCTKEKALALANIVLSKTP